VPWTTSRVKGSPEPPAPYRSELAFPKVKFSEPLDLAFVPGANRIAVAQRRGGDQLRRALVQRRNPGLQSGWGFGCFAEEMHQRFH